MGGLPLCHPSLLSLPPLSSPTPYATPPSSPSSLPSSITPLSTLSIIPRGRSSLQAAGKQARGYTLHPTPYTLHPTPYTLHLTRASAEKRVDVPGRWDVAPGGRHCPTVEGEGAATAWLVGGRRE